MFYPYDPIHQPETGTLSVSQHTDTQQALKQRPAARPDTGMPQQECLRLRHMTTFRVAGYARLKNGIAKDFRLHKSQSMVAATAPALPEWKQLCS